MRRLSIRSRLGNAAAVLFGAHGAVTCQARQCGCSRQTAYDHARQVQEAVADAQRAGPSRQQLLDENQRLRAENQQLWDWLDQSFACPKAKRRQFAVQAAALGLSLQQTLTLLAILLPAALLPGRATLGRWVRQDARRARRLLQVLDGACRTLVVCLCLDEIFFRRQPVLMGVEPFSLAWVLGERTQDRSGPTWAQALAAWPEVEDVAADGGRGIELGLALAVAKRQEEATNKPCPAKGIRIRLDTFHTPREVYERPRTHFVTDFIGESNILPVRVIDVDQQYARLKLDGFSIAAPRRDQVSPGRQLSLVIRLEHILLSVNAERHELNQLRGRVTKQLYQGSLIRYELRIGEHSLVAESQNILEQQTFPLGAEVTVAWHPASCSMLLD